MSKVVLRWLVDSSFAMVLYMLGGWVALIAGAIWSIWSFWDGSRD